MTEPPEAPASTPAPEAPDPGATDDLRRYGVSVLRVRALRGPNVYAYLPVLQVTLDVEPYEECPSTSFPGFADRLLAWLPTLKAHECSVGRSGGFVRRLQRGTYLAHICEHVALELQSLIGFDVAFGRVRGTGERGVYNVIVAFKEEEPAPRARARRPGCASSTAGR